MSEEKKYYCFCGSNCKYETMTKEQILAAITQAVKTGKVGNVDTGFISKVKEKNGGSCVTFWVGTQEQYNAVKTKDAVERNCLYIITDDTMKDDIEKAITEAQQAATAATEAAASAAAAAAALTPVDVTNQFTFQLSGSTNPTGLINPTLVMKKALYVPALQIVYFTMFLDFEKGTMVKDRSISFEETQKVFRATQTGLFISDNNMVGIKAAYCWFDVWTVNDQYVHGGEYISGWFFVEGATA